MYDYECNHLSIYKLCKYRVIMQPENSGPKLQVTY